jgi:ribosomal protein S18 acetylase RimI-like enzyme
MPHLSREQEESRLEPQFRSATADDAGAIALLAYYSGQGHCETSTSHLIPRGPPGPTAERIYMIRRLVGARTVSWLHHSHYEVAQVDGRVAASLGAFGATDSGNLQLIAALKETGWTDREIAAMSSNVRVYVRVEPSIPRDALMIENVATLPELRGRGLVSALLERALERGREQGYLRAQMACHIGNDAALHVYERAGFEITEVLADPEFEVVFGCPGMWRLVKLL